jgi:hypothetical protein
VYSVRSVNFHKSLAERGAGSGRFVAATSPYDVPLTAVYFEGVAQICILQGSQGATEDLGTFEVSYGSQTMLQPALQLLKDSFFYSFFETSKLTLPMAICF